VTDQLRVLLEEREVVSVTLSVLLLEVESVADVDGERVRLSLCVEECVTEDVGLSVWDIVGVGGTEMDVDCEREAVCDNVGVHSGVMDDVLVSSNVGVTVLEGCCSVIDMVEVSSAVCSTVEDTVLVA